MSIIATPAPASETAAGPRKPEKRSKKRSLGDWLILGVALLIGLFIAFPLILIVINSFKSPQDYATGGPLSLPNDLYFDGLTAFWQRVNFRSEEHTSELQSRGHIVCSL